MQQVVTNLQISQIELRSEDSFDIQRYVHERQVEKFVVPFQGEILEVKTAFLKVHTKREGRRGKGEGGKVLEVGREGVLTFVFLRFCLVWWVGWLGWASSTTLMLTVLASTRSYRRGTSTG